MKVAIVGSGIGGLTCAIACAQAGLEVEILEKASKLLPIGAGVQIPPNASRVAQALGYIEKLRANGVVLEALDYRRYANGKLLYSRANDKIDEPILGAPWLVIHRADYVDILLEAAQSAGAKLRLDAELNNIDFNQSKLQLKDGSIVHADVIVGADGLWSTTRNLVLGHASPPVETGDLAYRGTFSRSSLDDLEDPAIAELCDRKKVTVWLGPNHHAVFYPLKGGQEYNLVLCGPDTIPEGLKIQTGEVEEMRAHYADWDSTIFRIISCLQSALKWKLCHHEELETWTKNNVALLGDACHPTLPYQAQGAAMAVEDGAVLGRLLGLLQQSEQDPRQRSQMIPDLLQLYESLRKPRSTRNVEGTIANRHWYHLPDGAEQVLRDKMLSSHQWGEQSQWSAIDLEYNMFLYGWDSLKHAENEFALWKKTFHPSSTYVTLRLNLL
ncbi:hypothetical protein NX059_007615 [Plenodomus lindquistii]|nr:hypothetical protein NX059_007615 [Plenodomus lindquistii]